MTVREKPHQIEVGAAVSLRRLQRLLGPGLATIVGGQNQRPEAYGHALPGIEEMHSEQRAIFFTGQALDLPGVAAIAAIQDRSPMADCPA
ncbi:hypothetical protein D3C84_992590 [compost metagenome]